MDFEGRALLFLMPGLLGVGIIAGMMVLIFG